MQMLFPLIVYISATGFFSFSFPFLWLDNFKCLTGHLFFCMVGFAFEALCWILQSLYFFRSRISGGFLCFVRAGWYCYQGLFCGEATAWDLRLGDCHWLRTAGKDCWLSSLSTWGRTGSLAGVTRWSELGTILSSYLAWPGRAVEKFPGTSWLIVWGPESNKTVHWIPWPGGATPFVLQTGKPQAGSVFKCRLKQSCWIKYATSYQSALIGFLVGWARL